jgi:hypothetical protein
MHAKEQGWDSSVTEVVGAQKQSEGLARS